MSDRCSVACSSLCPPDRKAIPATAGGTQLLRTRTVFSATSPGDARVAPGRAQGDAEVFGALSDALQDRKRVAFVGVDTTDYSGDARAFLSRYGVSYPNVRDTNGRVLHGYGGLPIPRTFVVARSGKVNGYIFGEARAEELESAIRKALEA